MEHNLSSMMIKSVYVYIYVGEVVWLPDFPSEILTIRGPNCVCDIPGANNGLDFIVLYFSY